MPHDRRFFAGLLFAMLAAIAGGRAHAQPQMVDTALVLAVDVSDSVDSGRYRLQMDGIARAFEDREIQRTILGGPHGALAVALVEWADRPRLSVPWTLISDVAGAQAFAQQVRTLPRASGQFTCMSRALQLIGDKVLPFLPLPAIRTIIDVSGDGHDNCNPERPVDSVRDELAAAGVTINGLPILEGEESATLEPWYRAHVIGGPFPFLIPANGFEDFQRAMRQKFLLEISGAEPSEGYAPSSRRTMAAPSTIAFILPKAESRGRYLSPQSGATTMRSAGTWGRARRMRAATVCGVSTAGSERSSTPSMIVLLGSASSTEQSSFDCAVSIETWCAFDCSSSGRKE
jgi:hypothetical protein